MTNMLLSSRLHAVNLRIERACYLANRNPNDVRLLAVSKHKPLSDIIELHAVKQRDFAENYAQEAISKRLNAPFDDGCWHFIGPLQSNKSRGIAECYDWIHTIDRFKIAKRLSDQRPAHLPPLNALIQVNISRDPAKSGVNTNQVERLATQINELPNLRFRGIMSIPEANLPPEELTQQFSELKNLQMTLINIFPDCTELSMGMSNDFEIAIACGSTMIRVGSDIFGPRVSSDTPIGENT